MKSVINLSAISNVAKAETNYFAFGAKYRFAIKASPCTNKLQDVEMVLFCEGPQGNSTYRKSVVTAPVMHGSFARNSTKYQRSFNIKQP